MRTATVLRMFVVLPLALAACSAPMIPVATETDRAWCESLAAVLPSRSHSDTAQTQAEIGTLYDFYAGACHARD